MARNIFVVFVTLGSLVLVIRQLCSGLLAGITILMYMMLIFLIKLAWFFFVFLSSFLQKMFVHMLWATHFHLVICFHNFHGPPISTSHYFSSSDQPQYRWTCARCCCSSKCKRRTSDCSSWSSVFWVRSRRLCASSSGDVDDDSNDFFCAYYIDDL